MSNVDWQPIRAVEARKATGGSHGAAVMLELSAKPDEQWERLFNSAHRWPAGWPRPKAAGGEVRCEGVPEDDVDSYVGAVKDLIDAANESYRNFLGERRRQDIEKLAQEGRDDAMLQRFREILKAD
jgi:hypothetical protein